MVFGLTTLNTVESDVAAALTTMRSEQYFSAMQPQRAMEKGDLNSLYFINLGHNFSALYRKL